jgi:hypothetical protein
MASHEFMLKLNREVTEEEVEELYRAGCDDAAVETGPLGTMIDFTREAPTLAEALVSAVRDVEKIAGLRAVGVACDNMVTLLGIAERVGVSREAVRQWAVGGRGPGGFPSPVLVTTGGEQVWDWQQVDLWLHAWQRPRMRDTYWSEWQVRLGTLCAADRVLAARHALRNVLDEEIREELEQLLQDA